MTTDIIKEHLVLIMFILLVNLATVNFLSIEIMVTWSVMVAVTFVVWRNDKLRQITATEWSNLIKKPKGRWD